MMYIPTLHLPLVEYLKVQFLGLYYYYLYKRHGTNKQILLIHNICRWYNADEEFEWIWYKLGIIKTIYMAKIK